MFHPAIAILRCFQDGGLLQGARARLGGLCQCHRENKEVSKSGCGFTLCLTVGWDNSLAHTRQFSDDHALEMGRRSDRKTELALEHTS